MSETGVVKFQCDHLEREPAPFASFDELNATRHALVRRGLIGVDAHGVGFGNLSVRDGATKQFFITGSGTGGLSELGLRNYAKVTAYDFARNWLRCEGRMIASAESLTHAAVYEADPTASAILHVHSHDLWKRGRKILPTTTEAIEYGTPAMAAEVRRLFAETDVRERRIFVMAGHADGVVVFGKNLAEALALIAA
ncbi:MAG: class II aldolase/adducin family protein [Chthoniobacterales bacterium]